MNELSIKDIEELGWYNVSHKKQFIGNHWYELKSAAITYLLQYRSDKGIYFGIRITRNNEKIFEGGLNNKSELNVLMRQLKIGI